MGINIGEIRAKQNSEWRKNSTRMGLNYLKNSGGFWSASIRNASVPNSIVDLPGARGTKVATLRAQALDLKGVTSGGAGFLILVRCIRGSFLEGEHKEQHERA